MVYETTNRDYDRRRAGGGVGNPRRHGGNERLARQSVDWHSRQKCVDDADVRRRLERDQRNPFRDHDTEEFTWGTVTHETDPETNETRVNVTVETEDDVSIAVTAAPNASADRPETETDADRDAETETFPGER